MATDNIYNYPAAETADLIFGEGKSNDNSADLARLGNITDNVPAGTDLDAIRAYVDEVHGDDASYQPSLARVGATAPKVWEFLRLRRVAG